MPNWDHEDLKQPRNKKLDDDRRVPIHPKLDLFDQAVKLISEGMSDKEFDEFSLALDGDAHLGFENAVEAENVRRNPKKYAVQRRRGRL